jgi:hypothetical protein
MCGAGQQTNSVNEQVMKNECMSAALTELFAAGVQNRDIVRSGNGKHNQLRWPGANGRERMLVVPVSASDHRAADNMRAVVRRMLREDGMLPTAAEAEFEADKKPIDRMAFLEKRLAAVEHRLAVLERSAAKDGATKAQ